MEHVLIRIVDAGNVQQDGYCTSTGISCIRWALVVAAGGILVGKQLQVPCQVLVGSVVTWFNSKASFWWYMCVCYHVNQVQRHEVLTVGGGFN